MFGVIKLMSLPPFFHHWRCDRKQDGFSLVEMLVIISIFTIMTGVVLANLPTFRDKTALDLIAQEIATTIRQAQVYGIGTRVAGVSYPSYGVYFALDNSYGLDEKSFYLYGDVDGAVGFGGPMVDSVIEKFTIRGAAKIVALRGCDGSCTSQTPLLILDILFKRPYPEANFGVTAYSYVKMVIESTRDSTKQKEIQVWNTGQIVVKSV